ncbi:MAG: precorrin-8X methylmutase [Pseudomonadota bacterium]
MLDASTGVLICGHGSRSQSAVREFAVLADRLATRFPEAPVRYGYLEFANPVLRDGLDALREKGVSRILAVPGMLFAASHAKNDIPSVLNTYAAKHGLPIDYGRELGVDARMLRAAGARVQAAMDAADAAHGPVPAAQTCLVVVGRGASDPDANGNVAKVARLLWEGFGFGWAETAYSGVTFPLVAPCLSKVARLGYARVIVFPYFLFSGILIDRIYGFVDEAAAAHPDITFQKASYLGDHPDVIDTFAERVTELLDGPAAMNCGLCKYRTQVLGFEAEVGAPQESHHHHVEGMGASAPGSDVAGCALCETFCTGACRVLRPHSHAHGHDHHHHHHYPHEAHPLGPLSVVREGPLRYERDPAAITARSFQLLRAAADFARFGVEAGVAERVVHACGDPSIVGDLVIHDGFTDAVRDALKAGAPVIADCEMVRAAVSRRAIDPARIICHLNDQGVAEEAEARGTTRSAAALFRAADALHGGIALIGNAPTALFGLLELMRKGVRPAAIVAFPVGFVGAAESKEALLALADPPPVATLRGRRGGSAMGAAALNAVALS